MISAIMSILFFIMLLIGVPIAFLFVVMCFFIFLHALARDGLPDSKPIQSRYSPSTNLAPEKQQMPTNQEDKRKEQEKKKKTALQWAVEQQKKENARQRALARQAEQVRIAQAQSEHYKQFGIGH